MYEDGDIASVLITEEAIREKTAELAEQVGKDYADLCSGQNDLLLVGVLKGAVMFMTDFARALPVPVQLEFMAVSSYGSATSSSGVVRILKDLDRDIADRHVLIVEDIIDSGLTLSWLRGNLESRRPASLEVCTLLRKPDASKVDGARALRGLRHPERVRRRLRARLRRALPRPAVHRDAEPRRLQLSEPAEGGTRPRAGRWTSEHRRRGTVDRSAVRCAVASATSVAAQPGGPPATLRGSGPSGVLRSAVLRWHTAGGSRQGGRPTEAEAAWTASACSATR